MLVAHLVPGYFAVVASKRAWQPDWTATQRRLLWSVAFASTALPDTDVIYNAAFRGFVNHSLLWTHSIFPPLGLLAVWFWLRCRQRNEFVRAFVGLAALGWLSHLALDIAVHGTPLFYPFTTVMVGYPPVRVLQGGLWYYLTDWIFLFEPVFITLAIVHWAIHAPLGRRLRLLVAAGSIIVCIIFVTAFLILLPTLQDVVAH